MEEQKPTAHVPRVALLGIALAAGTLLLWRTGLVDAAPVRAIVGEDGPAALVLFALAYAAAMVGGLVAFGIARRVDRTALDRASGRHRERVSAVLDEHGTLAVLWARLFPLAPFTVVDHVAGMSALGTREYVVGTALGIVPRTVVYVAVGVFVLSRPDLLVWAGLALLLPGAVAGRRVGTGARPGRREWPGRPGGLRRRPRGSGHSGETRG